MMRGVVHNEVLETLRDIGRAVGDHRRGRTRCRIESHVRIEAAREVVWQTIWSSRRAGRLMPVDYRITPLNDAPGQYQASLTVNGRRRQRTFRVNEVRENRAVSASYVSQETEPGTAVCPHGFALVLEESGASTVLTHVEDVSLRRFRDRILYPLKTRALLLLCKARSEARPHNVAQPDAGAALLGIASTAVAFFAFWYVTGFAIALLLIAALATHEFGHVLAMRIMGMPTSGLYVVPFMGGAVLSRSKFRNQLDNAFCALMGPGFGLLPSVLFFAAYCLTGHAVLGAAAALFALVNLLILLPVPHFDGGTLVKAIFHSLSGEDLRRGGWALFAAGFAISIYQGMPLFGIAIALIAFVLSDLGIAFPEHAPMSKSATVLILSAMIITVTVYCAILYCTLKDSGVAELIAVR